MTTGDYDVKTTVKAYYGDFVIRAVESDSGDDPLVENEKSAVATYDTTETEGVPPDALAASAGCGNPVALASLKPGETVVDFGCGGGIDCFMAARTVGPEGRVIGIDMTEEMIHLAWRNAGKTSVTNVEFHVAEMEHTPLVDGEADVVISNCVICLSPDKDAVFAEAFRILRPGGRLYVSDIVAIGDVPAPKDSLESWADCSAHADPKPAYLARLAQARFEEISIISETPFVTDDGESPWTSLSVSAVRPI